MLEGNFSVGLSKEVVYCFSIMVRFINIYICGTFVSYYIGYSMVMCLFFAINIQDSECERVGTGFIPDCLVA